MKPATLFITVILCMTISIIGCSPHAEKPEVTFLPYYGQVDKLNGKVKQVMEIRWRELPYTVVDVNPNGDVISVAEVWKTGSSKTKCFITKGPSGDRIKLTHRYVDNDKGVEELFYYNQFGQPIRYCSTGRSDSIKFTPTFKTLFKYDEQGDLVAQFEYYNNELWDTYEFKKIFNAKHMVIGMVQFNRHWRDDFKKTVIDTTRYIKFDSQGNWLKAVAFNGDTTTRKVTYY